ncbi:hypothetical protein [Teichococcus rhizosphaerae]|nr:hypothetical protein [Pseudoroseomonas rhizosphaerae]
MASKTITVSNTTLFRVAAQQLGDARDWWRIARLNGLTDPMVVGLVTLQIPEPRANSGGGLPDS